MTAWAMTSGTAVNAVVAASERRARASSSGPSRTVPGPNSAKNSATAASAMFMAEAPRTRVKARTASSPKSAAALLERRHQAARDPSDTSVWGVAGMPAASRHAEHTIDRDPAARLRSL